MRERERTLSSAEDREGISVADRAAEAFTGNATYFEMMREWHGRQNGCAVETRVLSIIESHCQVNASILDAGCGEGSVTRWFADKHPSCRFTGVDVSPIGIAMAARDAPPNTSFQVAELEALPFEPASFDFVFSQSVIEHVRDWQGVIREMRRVLRPGGSMLIRVGNGNRGEKRLGRALIDLVLRRNRVIHCRPSFELEKGNNTQHMSNFDLQEIPSEILTRAIRRAGFRVTYLSTCQDDLKNGASGIKRLLFSVVGGLGFWPFSHLGYTTVVVGQRV